MCEHAFNMHTYTHKLSHNGNFKVLNSTTNALPFLKPSNGAMAKPWRLTPPPAIAPSAYPLERLNN